MDGNDTGELSLTRLKHGRDKLRRYRVEIDEVKVGTIAAGETKSFPLPLGEHRVKLRIDWCASPSTGFHLEPEDPSRQLWCCAGSPSHIEDIVIRRDRYIQLGGRQAADDMPARARFDIRHFVLLLLAVVLIAIVIGVVVAVI